MQLKNNMFDIEDESCINYTKGFDNAEAFAKDFRKKYSLIIGYHATKLNELEKNSILTGGLKLSTRSFLKRKAIDRFIDASDPIELKNKILIDIDNYYNNNEVKEEINFNLYKNELIETSYQYLIFGPETILTPADELSNKFNVSFRQRMINFGQAYIIKAIIPVKHTRDIWVEDIYEYLVNDGLETNLIYHRNLPVKNIVKIEEVDEPADVFGMPM